MTQTLFHRRRAERFAQLLDEAGGPRRHHTRSGLDDRLAELVAIGHQTRTLRPTVEMDAEFRTGLRALLVATAEREGIGRTAHEPPEPEPSDKRRRLRMLGRPSRVRARGAIIVGVALGAITVSGMSAASENAVPGDALYGVKRSAERAQLALASSDVTRGQLYLDFAHTRVAEAAAVRRDAAGFAAVLNDMDTDTRLGVRLLATAAVVRRDPAALDAVESFVTVQRLELGSLLGQVAHDSRARTLESLSLLDAVTKRADALRSTLSCGNVTGGEADRLGPKPRQCTAGGTSDDRARDHTTQGWPSEEAPTHRRTETAGAVQGQDGADGSSAVDPALSPVPVPTGGQGEPAAPTSGTSDDDGLLTEVGQILGDLLG